MSRTQVTCAVLSLVASVMSSAFESSVTALEILAPVDFHVVQIANRGSTSLPVTGTLQIYEEDVPRLEWRLIGASGNPSWEVLSATHVQDQFSATLPVDPGGWYRLDLRQLHGGEVVGQASVEHVGVGEIFVVAGQSNSANHGEKQLTPETNRVVVFDGQRWHVANDPQPGASGSGGSFLPPLGDEIVRRYNKPVGFVACGIGATSVREWLPRDATFLHPPTIESRVVRQGDGTWTSDGRAFDRLIARMRQLGPHGFRAVLWHQGESDANQRDPTRTLRGDLYREYLSKLVERSRAEIGWDVPWFVAQATYHVPGDEGSDDIRDAQASLWREGIALQGPDTDTLKGPLREQGGRGVHFSEAGQRAHARLWADRLIPWLEGKTNQP